MMKIIEKDVQMTRNVVDDQKGNWWMFNKELNKSDYGQKWKLLIHKKMLSHEIKRRHHNISFTWSASFGDKAERFAERE